MFFSQGTIIQFTQKSSNSLWVHTAFRRKLSIVSSLPSLPGPPHSLNVLLGKSLHLKRDGADSGRNNWLFKSSNSDHSSFLRSSPSPNSADAHSYFPLDSANLGPHMFLLGPKFIYSLSFPGYSKEESINH